MQKKITLKHSYHANLEEKDDNFGKMMRERTLYFIFVENMIVILLSFSLWKKSQFGTIDIVQSQDWKAGLKGTPFFRQQSTTSASK